mmetsp:Transcript_6333/g.16174  ORF Transcript_6333/g.16174 Transcript_6333/m.16174 type:complete len:216 (-) Transcript_6333:550-1197(-)
MISCSSVGSSQMTVSRLGSSGFQPSASWMLSSSSMATTGPAAPASAASMPEETFVRRSRCGATSPRSCCARWLFIAAAKGLAPRTLPRSMGSLNCLTNVLWFPRSPGCAKSISAHMSCSAFWTGVPVSSRRHRDRSLRRLLLTSVEMFFMRCASSQTTTSQTRLSPGFESPKGGSSASGHSSSPSSPPSPASAPPASSFLFFAPFSRFDGSRRFA